MSTTFTNTASTNSSSVNAPALNIGFLLDGKWHTDGEPVEIRSPGTGQACWHHLSRIRKTCGSCHRGLCSRIRRHPQTRRLRTAESIALHLGRNRKTSRRTGPHHGAGSGQAAEGVSRRSRSRDLHVRRCRRRSGARWRRVPAAGLASLDRGPLGNCAEISARADCRDHSFQLSHQSCSSQTRSSDRGGLHHHP